MNYFQWFFKKGWKPYCVPFSIIILIDYGVSREWQEIIQLPWFGLFLAAVSVLGSNIGMTYHSILNWKLDKTP